PFRDDVYALAFSPDSGLLAAATVSVQPGHVGESEVHVWEMGREGKTTPEGETPGRVRKEVLTFRGHAAQVNGIAFSPDGRRIPTPAGNPSPPRLPGEVKVWNARTGAVELTLGNPKAGFRGVAFSPEGARLAAVGTDGLVRVWESAGGRALVVCAAPERPGYFGRVAFSPH